MSFSRGTQLVNLVLSGNINSNIAEIIQTIEPKPLDVSVPSEKHSELSEGNRQLLLSVEETSEQKSSEVAIPEPSVFEDVVEYEELSEPYLESSSSYNLSVYGNDSSTESDNEILENIEKRKANRINWHRSFVKKLRLNGKKYINRSGKEVPDQKPKNVDCSKYRYKCSEHFSQGDREAMCQEYYNLADVHQKIHLKSLMQKVPVVRKLDNPKSKNRQTSEFII
ncbi:uncharacterized protein [Diabrotica undecimpunctata]|uniref:uncharacterized protein n=1 Tax=Diabrotica undecimpunctata TaxID=50387 RepID=UPI003B6375D2